ncbi:MAG: HEAT repeat domain-containing protein [Planctomycetota bacterium]
MTCEEFLELWDRGDRSPEVAAHVASCPECRSVLAVDGRVRSWQPAMPMPTETQFLESLRSKLEGRPAPRLRGPRPSASGPGTWLRFAAAAVLLAAMGAAFLLGRASRPPEKAAPRPIADAPRPAPVPQPVESPAGTGEIKPKPLPDPKAEFRERLMAAAAGAGRDAFLLQVKGGMDRARWIAAFRSSDEKERGAAVTIATILKDAALAPDLAAAAARGDQSAIKALGEIGGPESVAVLASLAGVPSRRASVEEALAATGRPEAGEALAAIGAWDNEAAWRRLGETAAPAIVSRLKSSGGTRYSAIRAAEWARAKGAVPELTKLLAKRETAPAAARALSAIGGWKAAGALAAVADDFDTEMIELLKKTEGGRAAVERRLLDVRVSATDRTRAARTLVAMGDHAAEAALMDALDSPEIRAEAARALGDFKCEAAVADLVSILDERRCRDAAAEALAKIGSVKAIPALIAASRDRSFYEEATRAIATIGSPEAVPHLISALKDRDLSSLATTALGAIKDARAILPLIGALEGPNAGEAFKALQSITGEKLPSRQDAWVRWWKARSKNGRTFDLQCF